MLSKMLNCCHRLEKFTFPSMRSGFPRWTKVRSWRMRPLRGERGQNHFKKFSSVMFWTPQMSTLAINTHFTYKYGMQGGSTSARAALYARKDEELSINVQYSSSPWERKQGMSQRFWPLLYNYSTSHMLIDGITPRLTSEVCFCHSSLLMGAESRADSIAK